MDIFDVCAEFGIKLNSRNQACCPLHKEKTPSFMIYEKTNSFYCHGCHIGGDSIRLKALLSGQSDAEILKQINVGMTKDDYRRIAKEKAKREAEKKQADYEDRLYIKACDRYREIQDNIKKYSPLSYNHDGWIFSVPDHEKLFSDNINALLAAEAWFSNYEEQREIKRWKEKGFI